jgi:hypothetical protein
MVSGCSIVNMTKGPGDYYRHWYAKDLKESIDSSVRHEKAKGATPGYEDRTYSEENWNEMWNRRIYSILDGDFHEAYVGPSQVEFYEYIISERRKAGLPELKLTEETKAKIEQVAGGNG